MRYKHMYMCIRVCVYTHALAIASSGGTMARFHGTWRCWVGYMCIRMCVYTRSGHCEQRRYHGKIPWYLALMGGGPGIWALRMQCVYAYTYVRISLSLSLYIYIYIYIYTSICSEPGCKCIYPYLVNLKTALVGSMCSSSTQIVFWWGCGGFLHVCTLPEPSARRHVHGAH